jgi:hypothetical protein
VSHLVLSFLALIRAERLSLAIPIEVLSVLEIMPIGRKRRNWLHLARVCNWPLLVL